MCKHNAEYRCPKCKGSNLKKWALPHPLIVHWVLNPGLAINEVLLGQRLPSTQLICRDCDGPMVDRSYVPCPNCKEMHLGRLSSKGYAFKRWRGSSCPSCGGEIPCLWNLFSLLILGLTSPLWLIPYLMVFRGRPLKPLYDATDKAVKQLKPVTKKTWISMGVTWGFLMWVIMSLFPALFMNAGWGSALAGIPIWTVGGLFFSFSMWFLIGREKIGLVKPPLKAMKAIVLSFDKYRSFADHMITCYDKLWPNHPFTFHVPYQELPATQDSTRVHYHQCPSDIKGTVLSLLDGLDDEEMIYWCIDDKYPIELDLARIEGVHRNLSEGGEDEVSGLLFCRCRGMLKNRNLTGEKLSNELGDVYLERADYQQIWIHQYLKVKVIRHLFNAFPDEMPVARVMDQLKKEVKRPADQKLYVTSENWATFGESSSAGVVTKNCYLSMLAHEFPIPVWVDEVIARDIIMGDE